MKISPTSAISKIGQRFGERRNKGEPEGNPGMTSDDERNIQEFSDLVRSAMSILESENEALASGDVRRVSSYYEEKSRILRDLSIRGPVVEPFLKEESPQIVSLREIIRSFSALLERNGDLLEGMASASKAIVSEVESIRKRHSLDGLYDKSGQRVKTADSEPGKIIRNL